MSPMEDRRARLERQYFFKCECRACKADWPTALDIKNAPDVFLCPRCGATVQNPAKSKKCPKCKGDLAGLGKFARKMAEFNSFAKKIAAEALKAAEDEGLRVKQQEVLRELLMEMERWLKMPNFKFIICQQLFTNSFSMGGNFRRKRIGERQEMVSSDKIEEIEDSSE